MRSTSMWAYLIVGVVFLADPGSARCADVKIAVVDMGRVMKAFPETVSADALLEKDVEAYEAERDQLIEAFNELKNEFAELRKEATDKALSESGRDKKKELAEQKLLELREHERKIRETSEFRQKQIADRRLRMSKRIVGKLHETVAGYARDKGYTLVLDSSEKGLSQVSAVVYNVEHMDITEDIIKIAIPDVPDEE